MSAQEEFWRGDFGNEYTERCIGKDLVANNIEFFRRSIRELLNVPFHNSVIEFGANRGLNIKALELLGFDVDEITAVEINAKACDELRKIDGLKVVESSIYGYDGDKKYDLVISKGLLIHIHPNDLHNVYGALYNSAKVGGHILVAEYFAPKTTEVLYRGNDNRLWRGDFAGDMLGLYSDLKLVDYGFISRRDPIAPQDDLNWWLLKRVAA